MYKTELLSGLLLLMVFLVEAQEGTSLGKGFSVGGHLTQHQRDFGIGLHLTTPYFAQGSIALRLRGNLMWNEYVQEMETTWTSYSNISLGLIGAGGEIGGFMRLYGEGGLIVLFPSNEFSSASSVVGGYGVFGFEFFLSRSTNYFIELGAVGTGATADEVLNEPIYSNGFLVNVGFRFLFSDN